MRGVLRRNSRLGVAHAELDGKGLVFRAYRYPSSLRRELDRVANEIAEYLQHAVAIGADGRQILRNLPLDRELLAGCQGRGSLQCFLHEGAGVDSNRLDGKPAGLNPRNIQQVAYQAIGT